MQIIIIRFQKIFVYSYKQISYMEIKGIDYIRK